MAKEPSMFETFQRLCLDKAGDLVAMREIAQAAGFNPYPDETDASKGEEAFMQDGPDGGRMLSISTRTRPGQPPIPSADEMVCGYSQNSSGAELADELARWAGVPAAAWASIGDEPTYVFTVTPHGQHRVLSNDNGAEIAEALRAGGVWMLHAGSGNSPAIVLEFLRASKTS
jgi:hypothetical protein